MIGNGFLIRNMKLRILFIKIAEIRQGGPAAPYLVQNRFSIFSDPGLARILKK
jgi:hypothetical protein